jgi:ABC-type hemin transport system substrate-binding protein
VPVVGALLEIDYERLLAAAPTVLLLQPPASGVDRELVRLADEGRFQLVARPLTSLEDVDDFLEELPTILELDARAAARLDARRAAFAALLAAREETRSRDETVLLLIAMDPPVAVGRGVYLDVLVDAVGAANALERGAYPELTLEDIVRLDPDSIVLLRTEEPSGADATRWREQLAGTATKAARSGRIAIVAHRDLLMPSSRFPDAFDAFRTAFEALPARAAKGGGVR